MPDELWRLDATDLAALIRAGLAVPVGAYDGLPMGGQIVSRRFREDLCLAAGEVIEMHEGPRRPIDPQW